MKDFSKPQAPHGNNVYDWGNDHVEGGDVPLLTSTQMVNTVDQPGVRTTTEGLEDYEFESYREQQKMIFFQERIFNGCPI